MMAADVWAAAETAATVISGLAAATVSAAERAVAAEARAVAAEARAAVTVAAATAADQTARVVAATAAACAAVVFAAAMAVAAAAAGTRAAAGAVAAGGEVAAAAMAAGVADRADDRSLFPRRWRLRFECTIGWHTVRCASRREWHGHCCPPHASASPPRHAPVPHRDTQWCTRHTVRRVSAQTA
jgi:hypothetical protein